MFLFVVSHSEPLLLLLRALKSRGPQPKSCADYTAVDPAQQAVGMEDILQGVVCSFELNKNF